MSKTAINMKDLLSTGVTFEVNNADDIIEPDDDDEMSKEEFDKEVLAYANMNCVGQFEDEAAFDGTEPFARIASKMTDVLENGDIKKLILRDGYGKKPEENCIVKVHYNAYTEFNEIPFDCTYVRKRPYQFILGQGAVIPGLDISIATMKLNEKSQFLIKSNYAYGSVGCLDRIPPNSTVLFEIELQEVIESGAAKIYENLPAEKKSEFSEVYKYCVSQCAKGKDLFNRNIKAAIKEYNMAVDPMENVILKEYDEEIKQKELLYKLYQNLVVCHTKIGEPKKACINFNKINDMTRGTDLKISAKAYYNNAKCLRMLGDFGLARKRLLCASKLEPRNPDILNEFKIIDEKQMQYKEKEKKLANAFLNKEQN